MAIGKKRAKARERSTPLSRGARGAGKARAKKPARAGKAAAKKASPKAGAPKTRTEERFLFPEACGANRVRLLVRDPEWLFAYWDVNPEAMKDLGQTLGERALALSRLTLRVLDPMSGGSSDILLPPGARWWYIRTDSARRTYRAELGVTLPSGEFWRLAESNAVVTPRVGPSPQRARRRMCHRDARELPPSAAQAPVTNPGRQR